MEKAMYYEMIVRRANGNGGRYCVAGADADIFRAMERLWCKGFDGKWHSTEFERGMALGEVSAFLRDSLKRLIKSGGYDEKTNAILQDVHDALLHPTLPKIDNAIDEITAILKVV